MIASSLKDEDGLVDLLLGKGADATIQNTAGQVGDLLCMKASRSLLSCIALMQDY